MVKIDPADASDRATGRGELVVIDGAGHHPHARTVDELLAPALRFPAGTAARA